jgi:hypothetical protein
VRPNDAVPTLPTASAEPSGIVPCSDAPRFVRIRRAGLLSATALIALNIWTGAPLLALWVGSRVVGERALSMTAVFVVVLTLAVLVAAMTLALTWLSARYDVLVGRPSDERRTMPWLRSMRAEQDDLIRGRRGTSALELIMIASTILAVVCFEVWFFFLAGSPLAG